MLGLMASGWNVITPGCADKPWGLGRMGRTRERGAGGTPRSRGVNLLQGSVRSGGMCVCVAFDTCLVPTDDFPFKIPPWARRSPVLLMENPPPGRLEGLR